MDILNVPIVITHQSTVQIFPSTLNVDILACQVLSVVFVWRFIQPVNLSEDMFRDMQIQKFVKQ